MKNWNEKDAKYLPIKLLINYKAKRCHFMMKQCDRQHYVTIVIIQVQYK